MCIPARMWRTFLSLVFGLAFVVAGVKFAVLLLRRCWLSLKADDFSVSQYCDVG